MQNPEQEKIRIFDTTLRDGEQTQGVSYNSETKLIIARNLAALGVDVIEAGFPTASKKEFDSVQNIAAMVDDVEIACLARTQISDIDRAYESIEPAGDRGLMHVFIGTSEEQEKKLKRDKMAIFRDADTGTARAVGYTPNTEFSPEDASRTDMQFMIDVIRIAVNNGVRIVNVPDTVGYAQPQEFMDRIKRIRDEVPGDYILSVHCHNDMGMAAINSLYGVLGGARQVEGTINGMGERAGNTALEQIVMAMHLRPDVYPFTTNVDISKIGSIAELIEQYSKYPIDRQKPYTGMNVNVDAAGTHQVDEDAYRIFHQEDLGIFAENFPISKLSGTAGLRKRAQNLGFNPDQITRNKGGQAMDDWCDEHEREAMDTDIERVVADALGVKLEPIIELIDKPSFNSDGNTSRAKLTIKFNGEVHTGSYDSKGGGTIEALINGVKEIAGVTFIIDDWEATGIDHGATSRGLITMKVLNGDVTVTASAIHRSVDQASLDAYINGVNTILRTKKRRQAASAR